jgi:transcriptional regulator with XRE-family HTH domain
VKTSALRRAREKAGLSQRALAVKGGISAQAVSQFETGENSPKLSTAQRLAKALGLEVGQLFPMEGK